MKRFKKLGAIIFLGAYLIIGASLIAPQKSLAAAPEFTPQIGIPGSNFQTDTGNVIGQEVKNATTGETVMRSDLIGRYITAFYNWGFSIVGVIAVLMLMAAGVIWLTSGGDSGKIGNAKKMIEGALLGSALLVGSWFLLNTINPNLVNMPTIDMVIIKQVKLGCCDAAKDDGVAKMTTSNNCKDGTNFDENKSLVLGKCESEVCCVYDYPASNISYCFTSFSNVCSLIRNGTAVQSNCSSLTKCTVTNCNNTKDGYKPDGAFAKEQNLLCYNGKVYPSMGAQLGEPCGQKDNGYGICVKAGTPCNDTRQIFGRACDNTGLTCCLD